MDFGIFLAALGISLLELSEATAVAIIFSGIYRSNKPYFYAVLGILIVLIPVFTLGKYIILLPINYVLFFASIILIYFGYRLIRSARRSFKKTLRPKQEEKEEGITTVFVVSITESLEAGLVLLALIPQSYISSLLGAISSIIILIPLAIALKSRLMRIRVPQLKFVLSALLFSLASLFIGEATIGIDELFLPLFFLIYLGVNYTIIKI
ncbi:hypothetical protein DFR86_10260 [Acidianus sulfidivorans JP7]|uniref:Uncharacterized protein n=1 Tax=Acidianus sulfidivorans JP7 TaxID=619593 RepID=A0A2U9IPE5_9CREN|nr:hypothetical protein [Acidianus sulfidivorans]AWR97882.1 hypothetical protein DFR86_10260 [Acidianus sulfidivorans JP7]